MLLVVPRQYSNRRTTAAKEDRLMKANSSYSKAYSKQSFWQKIYGLSGAYRALKYKAILLWLLLKDDEVPLFVKTSIITALGYLITPIDLIPDFLLGGLVDDGAVLAWVLKLSNSYVTYGMEEEAERLCS